MSETCANCCCQLSAWLYWRKEGRMYCSESCADRDCAEKSSDDREY
ncbi:hypothetical protein [Bacillus toyonensis]|jgi:hypothetical protein|nr:hypothetical protein [Bacillus toyonensis]